jgi:hypothetical protein
MLRQKLKLYVQFNTHNSHARNKPQKIHKFSSHREYVHRQDDQPMRERERERIHKFSTHPEHVHMHDDQPTTERKRERERERERERTMAYMPK